MLSKSIKLNYIIKKTFKYSQMEKIGLVPYGCMKAFGWSWFSGKVYNSNNSNKSVFNYKKGRDMGRQNYFPKVI